MVAGEGDGDEVSAKALPAAPGGHLIIASAVREALKNVKGCDTALHCSADVFPTLNATIHRMLTDAAARCVANGRKTLKMHDL
jgi:hypothetical protein